MDIFASLQEEKKALLDELNRLFADLSVDGLMDIPAAIDNVLFPVLHHCMVKYSPQIFGADEPDLASLTIKCGGIEYHVTDSKNIQNEKDLIIAILVRSLEVDRKIIMKRSIKARLGGFGMYSSFTFMFPRSLNNLDEDLLKQFAYEIYSVGYNWMNTRIVTGVRNACETTNRELYDYVRIMVTGGVARLVENWRIGVSS